MLIEAEANSAPWSEQSFRNELTHSGGVFLVALLAGEVVGYGGMWLVIDEAHITTVAVATEHRRKGIARAIMVELLARAKRENVECSSLEVRAGNIAAIALYKALGYGEIAVRKGYYPDNREDAVVMWLYDLQQWAAS